MRGLGDPFIHRRTFYISQGLLQRLLFLSAEENFRRSFLYLF